jgi:hypothetical protein
MYLLPLGESSKPREGVDFDLLSRQMLDERTDGPLVGRGRFIEGTEVDGQLADAVATDLAHLKGCTEHVAVGLRRYHFWGAPRAPSDQIGDDIVLDW